MLKTRNILIIIGTLMAFGSQLEAQSAPWFFGVGAGITRMGAKGTEGFNTVMFGPVVSEFDLSPNEFQDLIETAIGGAGFATNGTWMAQLMVAQLKLGDSDLSATLPNTFTVVGDLSYDITVAEASLGRTVYRTPKFSITPHVGVRYIKHDISSDLVVTDPATGTAVPIVGGVDQNWTDVLVGASLGVALAPKWTWNVKVEGGGGSSNGTFGASTGISWQLHKRLSLTPNIAFSTVEFENGTIGDPDWYIYDADETSFGVAIFLHF